MIPGNLPQSTMPGIGKRVVVAMSGGVDSSVAAALLLKQGYEVIGLMMRLWSEPENGSSISSNRCCTPDQMADARRVADLLNIPFHVLDTKDIFYRTVVEFFIDEHQSGRTPNPCIECNRTIRFNYLLKQALGLGADFLATGHYARINHSGNSYQLLKAVDPSKDQSYVLHVLGQSELSRVLFPVGDFTKEEIRKIAQDMNLPVAQKSESQDLCFLRDGNYRRFLDEHKISENPPGPITDLEGNLLGYHTGLTHYTIGQRKGLGIALGYPIYVIEKDPTNNTLIVGSHDQSRRDELFVRNINWVSGLPPDWSLPIELKIRYRATPVQAEIKALGSSRAKIKFTGRVFGITPGQGAVFYHGDICLGGGIISGPGEDI